MTLARGKLAFREASENVAVTSLLEGFQAAVFAGPDGFDNLLA
jgi:hypothetical protein